jgi:phosphoribosylanthranilate isomerase
MAYSPLIKICGIKTFDLLEATIEAGADMVGFVHFRRSPRHVDLDTLAELIPSCRGRIESVVLLVDPDNSKVAEIAALDPDWIQLHGPETPHRVETVRADAGVQILKAVGVANAEDVAMVPEYEDVADRILLDAKAHKTTELPGGRGIKFDWTLLESLDPSIAFMLSGGLNPDNVAEAIASIQPMGIDVSSGVESSPGVKDAARIRAFIDNARAAAAGIKS